MKWIFLALWGFLAWQEVRPLCLAKKWGELFLWTSLSFIGLALGLWYFWAQTHWRLAEYLLNL